MLASIACVKRAWRSFGRLSGSQPSAWFWAWSWDPLKFMRRHQPHHLSPAQANHPAGQDPEARLSRPKSPQQRSDQARTPVNSEQYCGSYASAPAVSRARSCRLSVPNFSTGFQGFRRHDGNRQHELRSLTVYASAYIGGNSLDLRFLDGAQLRCSK